MNRRKSHAVAVANVLIGGDNPIVVQSMTDTDTSDVEATLKQVRELADAGSEIVRVTVNNNAAARAVPLIRTGLDDNGYAHIPLVGDFHFIGHRLLSQNPECAQALAKFRINPGNIGSGERKDANFNKFIEIACELNKPVRIGVNAGSLDKELLQARMDANARKTHPASDIEVENETLIESALNSAEFAEKIGLSPNQIILSCKVSRLNQMVAVYRELAARSQYALHLGLTEAGMGPEGATITTAALSILLYEGIGDTIRASITPEPNGKRTNEVVLCRNILQSLGIRQFKPHVTACPGCGRTTSTKFRSLAQEVQTYIESRMDSWRAKYPGCEGLKVAVMGCVVNGPGEARSADIAISLPGTGENPRVPVFMDGSVKKVLQGDLVGPEFLEMIEDYVGSRWGAP